jgi:dihydrofolate reductase
MRKIILDLAVTLDGFIEGPNGEIDWCIVDDASGSDDFLGDLLDEIDTIFYGRISYDLWGKWQPDENADPAIKKAYHSIRSKKKYVFSSTKINDEDAVIISSDIKSRVEEILNEPGKNIWLYGGGKLITTFMKLGLIDEFRLAVHPVILGAGKPLFNNIKDRVNLKLLNVKSSKSGVTVLTYERIS